MERNVGTGFSVEVVQSWKGQALDTELVSLDRPRRIAVGEVGRFLLSLGESFDVLVVDDGKATVHVPARATALVTEGESTREIGLETSDRSYVVGENTAIELTIGDMSFFVRPVQKEKEKFAGPIFDLNGLRWIGAALAFHVAILATFFFMPPDASALSSDLNGEQMRYIQVHLDAEQLVTPPAVPTGGDSQSGTSSAPSSAGGGETPTPAVSGGPGHAHVRAVRSTQPALTAATVSQFGSFEVLARAFADMDGDPSPYDAGNPALTTGPGGPGDAAIPGGVPGEDPGGIHMTAGHGTCTGDHCTDGTIDQHGLDTHGPEVGDGPELTTRDPHETTPTVRPSCSPSDPECRTVGGLTREQIRSVIARHRPEVRFCYEQALIGRPGLEGRVTVGFQIAQDGHVAASNAQGMSGVDTCVAQAARRWQFPTSASPTVVTYPFILESSSAQ